MKSPLASFVFVACGLGFFGFDQTFLGCCSLVRAQEAKNEAARVTATEPASIISGTKTILKVRGFKLKEATEFRFPKATEVQGEITEKKDAGPPKGLENKLVGDTQLLAEITIPANHPAGILEYVISTPAGDAMGKLRVLAADTSFDEAEPNNGFRESQELRSNQFARGAIQGDKDVDVYKIIAKAGQQLKVTVTSGGPTIMDAALHGYDARGQFLAAVDDSESRDPVLMLKSPTDGPIYVCVSSAHDIGGEWNSYLLSVEDVK
jgi:hypothetical protein